MQNLEIIGLGATVLLALLGYFATYINSLSISRREAALALVTRRLEEFYGPLYVLTQTNNAAWDALLRRLGRDREGFVFYEDGQIVDQSLAGEWRLWIEYVLMPQNERIEGLIIEKAHLIQEEKMPQCLLGFALHVASYRGVIEKWQQGDTSQLIAETNYPEGLNEYAQRSYTELKARQVALIGPGTGVRTARRWRN